MPIMLKMIDIFGSLRSLFKVQRASEDTFIFRLHYRATVAFLLAGCLTLACKSISGSPIHCESSGAVDKEVLETFCWLHTTYSMINAFNVTIGRAVPYPGVTNSKTDVHVHNHHPLVKQHKYYQWVIFALLLQAILFYTPRWLWKGWEGGKIHALMMDLDIGLCSEVEKKQKKKMLLDYLWENLRYHNWWAYRYYLCEVLALLNVVDVPHESFFRRCISHVWHRRTEVHRVRPRGSCRSHDLCFSEDDQMHFLQVRSQWRSGETRCCVHTSAECCQRENLCVPLVLVPVSWDSQPCDCFVQNCHNIFPSHQSVPPPLAISSRPTRCGGDNSPSKQSRRLVSPLHVRGKFGHCHLSGCDARAGEQIGYSTSTRCARYKRRSARGLMQRPLSLNFFEKPAPVSCTSPG
ncbi:innexin inx1 isoform X3 [Diachasmimorpha longicaudata]|uniref:innexin inx1 isoform X3 n=1 Tax=Diachasmimorpha longicaudata TaxID=58733 RepID=UPI0030B8D603